MTTVHEECGEHPGDGQQGTVNSDNDPPPALRTHLLQKDGHFIFFDRMFLDRHLGRRSNKCGGIRDKFRKGWFAVIGGVVV